MKNIISCRPLAFSGTSFLLFLLLFMNIDPWISFWTGLVLLSLLILSVIVWAVKKYRMLPLFSILLAITIAAAVSFCYNGIYYKNKIRSMAGTHECSFIVTDNVKYDPYYTVSHVTLTSVDGKECKIRTSLVSSFMAVLNEGCAYSAELELVPTKENFAFADTYDFSKGFEMSAYCEDTSEISFISKASHQPYTAISEIQNQISVFFNMYLDDGPASLCKALLDGDKSGLDVSVKQDFSQLGISHMLAISGMHLSVLIGFLAAFINRLKINKRGGFIVLTLITLIYVFLTGFTPSVVRSAIMLIMTYLAFWFRRRSDAVSALILSVSLICLIGVNSVFDIGLWLSFLATLGILLVGVPLCDSLFKDKNGVFFKILKWMIATLIVTLSATMFTFPVILLYFKETSAVFVLANLIFTLPITWILLLIMITVVISPIGFLTKAVAKALNWSCFAILWLADKLASPVYLLSLDYVFLYLVCTLAVILVAILLIKRKRALTLAVFAVVMSLVIIANALTFGIVSKEKGIGYFSKGANDALYVRSGANVLIIDNSNGGYSFISEAIAMSGAKRFSRVTLMLTHYHIYLAFGVSRLAQNGVIDTLILPSPDANEVNAHSAVKNVASTYNLEVLYYEASEQQISYNEFDVTVYSAKPEKSSHNAVMAFVSVDENVYAYYGNKSDLAFDFDIINEKTNVVREIFGKHSSKAHDKNARLHFYERVSTKN